MFAQPQTYPCPNCNEIINDTMGKCPHCSTRIIRWQVKFGGIKTNDPDYPRAKRNRNLAVSLWLIAIVALLVRQLLLEIILSRI